MPTCPIIDTREALYKGGMSSDDSEECSCSAKVGSHEVVFDDIPTLVGLESFQITRDTMRGASEGYVPKTTMSDDNTLLSKCRVTHELIKKINDGQIKELMKTGAADFVNSDEVIKKYATGNTLRDRERAMANYYKSL